MCGPNCLARTLVGKTIGHQNAGGLPAGSLGRWWLPRQPVRAGRQRPRAGSSSSPTQVVLGGDDLKCQKSPASDLRRVLPLIRTHPCDGPHRRRRGDRRDWYRRRFHKPGAAGLLGRATGGDEVRWTSSSAKNPRYVTEQDVSFGDRTGRCAVGPAPERRRDRRVAGERVRPGAGSRARVPVPKVEGPLSQSAR